MVASLIMHFNMLKIAYLEKNLEKFSYLVLSGPPVHEWYPPIQQMFAEDAGFVTRPYAED